MLYTGLIFLSAGSSFVARNLSLRRHSPRSSCSRCGICK